MSKFFYCLLLILLAAPASADAPTSSEPTTSALPEVHVYKTPTCGCCGKWIEHMRANGFSVKTTDMRKIDHVKAMNGVPRALSSCHTALVGGYVVEGHVPASDVIRLLGEKPAVTGIAVPRMPIGSPGMEGPNPQRYEVLAFDSDAAVTTFAVHGP
jgi:hypothetical protein